MIDVKKIIEEDYSYVCLLEFLIGTFIYNIFLELRLEANKYI